MSRCRASAGSFVGLCLPALLAVSLWTTGATPVGARAPAGARTPTVAAAAQLPRVLAASLAGADEQLVSAIAVDFDHDGDLDVVATDAELDLLVWVNDGRNHLTRRRPARTTGWQAEAPPPALDDLPAVSSVSTPNDPPSFRDGSGPSLGLADRSASLPFIGLDPSSTSQFSSLSSRAPPTRRLRV